LRTQQILAYETSVPATADPLAGSYAVESMTLDIERAARELIEKIDKMGGARVAIESGFVQHEIADSAYAAQKAIEEKRSVVVGVNDFVEEEQATLPLLVIDESVEREQVARLEAFRKKRQGEFRGALQKLDAAARSSENLMERIVECVRQDCTIGEIVATLKQTFGEHTESSF